MTDWAQEKARRIAPCTCGGRMKMTHNVSCRYPLALEALVEADARAYARGIEEAARECRALGKENYDHWIAGGEHSHVAAEALAQADERIRALKDGGTDGG